MPWILPFPESTSPSNLAVDIPHLAYPFVLTDDASQVAVNEQDSTAEIMACELLIADSPIQLREDRTDFGWDVPDMLMLPADLSGLVAALNRLEPRAVATLEPDGTPLAVLGVGEDDLTVSIQLSSIDPTGASLQPQ